MAKFLNRIMMVLVVVMIACASSGCKTTKKTEVKDKFFGGTQIKETTATEHGDKVTVTEKKTDYDTKGDKVKTETKTTGDTGSP
ncbi:MAG: hypothetical protein WC869_03340 [Phycisphaerae bacterium]|jgi:uncharacterized lipoprotein YehR (DUF1307 family)